MRSAGSTRHQGTGVVTATGMALPGMLAWGIPQSVQPLAASVGGIPRRECAGATADMLALTVVFDHAVTDGAPVGRFLSHLHRLLAQTECLAD